MALFFFSDLSFRDGNLWIPQVRDVWPATSFPFSDFFVDPFSSNKVSDLLGN